MPTLVLVRHGRTSANATGVLAGRTPGVHLDDTGRGQAQRAAERLAVLPLVRVVSSPLERTLETARALTAAQSGVLRVRRDKGLVECGYGAWTGRTLKELAREPLWRTVQAQPSAVVFPGGESLADVQRFQYSRVQVGDRGPRRRDDGDRSMRPFGQAERQKPRRTLVDSHMQAQQAFLVCLVEGDRQRHRS